MDIETLSKFISTIFTAPSNSPLGPFVFCSGGHNIHSWDRHDTVGPPSVFQLSFFNLRALYSSFGNP